MQIKKTKENQKLTISISGRVDTPSAMEFEESVFETLDGVTELVFDMKDMSYLSSAGLRVILIAYKQMKKQGKMKLVNVSDDIRDILDMTGFTDLYTIG
ncbi:MAG: STAS domain-containing protein [Ruminococcus sp.]|nr:STAS domain-containing protein [Ruminococcus sp.]